MSDASSFASDQGGLKPSQTREPSAARVAVWLGQLTTPSDSVGIYPLFQP